ncbi:LacI family DNA-binding transcriptional regulator [Micromonospora sp. BRA006-A]|nr:LacI family DNA-binding transcriptional regulator [Micromonospora sp. BRA006-A]
MPATIRDVARASGVHISTVSRTFSAPHLVNPETRVRCWPARRTSATGPTGPPGPSSPAVRTTSA